MIGKFSAVLNFNRLFRKLHRFICNSLLVLSDHSLGLGNLNIPISGEILGIINRNPIVSNINRLYVDNFLVFQY